MSKVIKVDDKVYEQLDRLRDKGETFSGIIQELLITRMIILDMISVLESQLKYREWQENRLRELEEKQRRQLDEVSTNRSE